MDTLQQFIKLNESTVGRDKLYRCVQYFSRYAAARPGMLGISAATKAKGLEGSLSMGRKLFRMFKALDYSIDAYNAWLSTPDAVLRALSTLVSLNAALRMVFDHVQWAIKVGLLKRDDSLINYYTNLFWFAGVLVSLARNLLKLWRVLATQRKRHAQHSGTAGSILNSATFTPEAKQLVLASVRDVCDLPVPAFALGWVAFMDTGMVGFSGGLASVIGLHEAWTKLSKTKTA